MTDEEYIEELKLQAKNCHAILQGVLDKYPLPYWKILDTYECLGDAEAYYTRAMKDADFDHPNCFKGSSNDWEERQ